MEKTRKYLEVIANIGLIICCILFAWVLSRNYFFTSTSLHSDSTKKPTSLKGKQLANVEIDWSKNSQTLLFILKKGCRFCDESSQFYQRIISELSNSSKIHLIAALPHTVEESQKHLKDKKVDISDIRQISANSISKN